MQTYRYRYASLPMFRTVLPNGLTVLTVQTDSDTASVELVFSVGSLDDGDCPGRAHFLEHALFEGPAREGVHPKLHDVVVRGVEGDAATSTVATRYFLDGLGEDVVAMIRALLSIGFDATITDRLVHGERGPILQELRECERENRFGRWYNPLVYPSVPVACHEPVGQLESVRHISAKTLRRFHARHYFPANAALIVASSMLHKSIVKVVAGIALPAVQQRERTARAIVQPTFVHKVYRHRDETPRIELSFAYPTDPVDEVFMGLALDLLTSPPFGLLPRRLRGKECIVYGVEGNSAAWPFSGTCIITASEPKNFSCIEEAILEEIDRLICGDYPEKALQTILARRRIFFATHGKQAPPDVWVSWMRDGWLRDEPDFNYEALTLSATREVIAKVAAMYFTREQYGCLRVISK